MARQIRVALIGIGNCASSLVQGISYYNNIGANEFSPGIIHPKVGNYEIKDIKIVLGFDIDARKVGQFLSEAIFAKPNVASKYMKVPKNEAPVYMGPILDGNPKHMKDIDPDKAIILSSNNPVDVVKKLQEHKVEVVVNYLPVGSKKATEFYAQCSIDANCAFVNCMPIFIGSNEEWVKRFKKAGIPVLGDDIKSQLGATWAHRMAIQAYLDRGIKICFTKQENYGGNTDFLNMTSSERIKTKLLSKKSSIEHLIKDHSKGGYLIPPVYAGPGSKHNNHGYIKGLGDNKIAKIRLEGKGFGNRQINMDIRLEVEDSPNSAGVVVDAIRCAKLGLDRKIGGAITSASSFLFKHPYEKIDDKKAINRIEGFIKGDLMR
ncbi:MAG TPA: inositol-3-phosphate synthase [Candidatus Nanoarchaeia archaeon]|nr:inositol-3-phosphate synthase [Candidatus Nanoarchaeia archaeon]